MAFYKLNVPKEEKDEAKSYGARWYPMGQYWYFSGEALPEGLKKWYPQVPKAGNAYPKASKNTDTCENSAEKPQNTDPYSKYKSVSDINKLIEKQYAAAEEFQRIYVKGEVTGFSEKKGDHKYFSIKDSSAILPCIIWNPSKFGGKWGKIQDDSPYNFELKNGQQTAIFGKLTFYAPYGKTSLIVENIIDIGEGLAKLAREKLRKQFENEGLFDAAHKKPIPKHPKSFGILTSGNGKAIRDIENTRKARNPYVQSFLYNVNVQGKKAVETMLEGLKVLDSKGYDFIIISRGGGGDEELSVYDNEALCRAIYAAKTPIVTAIGHTGNDFLADDIADLVCITPTRAATETLPDVMTDINTILLLKKNISDTMSAIINDRKLRISNRLALLEKNSPEARFKAQRDKLLSLTEKMRLLVIQTVNSRKEKPAYYLEKLETGVRRNIDIRKNRAESLTVELNALSPTAKLVGGFGYVSFNGIPVKSAGSVNKGDEINIKMHDGEITATVDKSITK